MLEPFSCRDAEEAPDAWSRARYRSARSGLDQRNRQPGNQAFDLIAAAKYIRVSDNRNCVVIHVKPAQQLLETRPRDMAFMVVGCPVGRADVLVGSLLRANRPDRDGNSTASAAVGTHEQVQGVP